VKTFLLAALALAVLHGCSKPQDAKTDSATAADAATAKMIVPSNIIPKELHEGLFADAQTNFNTPEYRALTSRVAKALNDYEQKQKK
jgi:hypothetical protein